jgi:hypothetical protein
VKQRRPGPVRGRRGRAPLHCSRCAGGTELIRPPGLGQRLASIEGRTGRAHRHPTALIECVDYSYRWWSQHPDALRLAAAWRPR